MTHILIKNVGPIKNVEFDLNKINVFMGPQSSGKSTIAKIISYCSWYEKNYILESKPLKDFYGELLEFHNLEDSYFSDDSYIEYQSKNCHIVFNGRDKKDIKRTATVGSDNLFKNEKIEYIPAERNVVAIAGIGEYNKTNKKESPYVLPLKTLGNISYYYTQEDDADHLILEDGKEIKLQHSSSGLISITPLLLVYAYVLNGVFLKKRNKTPLERVNLKPKLDSYDEGLKERLEKMMNDLEENRSRLNKAKKIFKELGDSMDDSVTKDVRSELDEIEKAMDKLQNEFIIEMGVDTNYNYSKVIIEEPELNLFPKTQQELVYYMLSVLNSDERDHQLVLTTHSPYILFALNNCMMGGLVKDNIPEKERLSFVSQTAWIDPKKVSIYEIHDGSLQTIQDEDGIIEDNYLNKAYKENSAEYLSLLNYFEDEE